jgi:hypothetical protein
VCGHISTGLAPGSRDPLRDVKGQPYIFILGPDPMLAKVSRTVLLEMGTPLVVVGFGLSEQLLAVAFFSSSKWRWRLEAGQEKGERDLEAVGETVNVEGARHGFCCLLVPRLASDMQDRAEEH